MADDLPEGQTCGNCWHDAERCVAPFRHVDEPDRFCWKLQPRLTPEEVKAAVIAKRREELADIELQIVGAKMRLKDAEEA